MVALMLALTDNKDEILDRPVDPNEPVYYLRHQVSFGEMVAYFDAPNEYKNLINPVQRPKTMINELFINSERKPRLVEAKSTSIHPPAMDMIKATIKSSQDRTRMSLILIKDFLQQHYNVSIETYGPFLRRAIGHGEDKNDDGKKMVRWAAFKEIKDGPHCSWAPMGGRGAARNISVII